MDMNAMNQNNVTIGSVVSGTYKQFSSLPKGTRTKLAGGIGALSGLIKSHNEDEGVIQSVLDVGMGMATSIGATSALSYIVENHGDQIKEFTNRAKTVTTGNFAVSEGLKDAEVFAKRAQTMKKVGGIAGRGALGLIAVASALSVKSDLNHEKQVERNKNEQELKMKVQAKQQAKDMRGLFGYDTPPDFGGIVMEMWDERIGHHLMGNSKFK
jgi:hypothetical protein